MKLQMKKLKYMEGKETSDEQVDSYLIVRRIEARESTLFYSEA